MNIQSGDIEGYRRASDRMRKQLERLSGRILVAHHGDCDGMVGGGLLARFLSDRGCEIHFASSAEFRTADFEYFKKEFRGCGAGVFVEAQGMPSEYAFFDLSCMNIDHHPHSEETPIRNMLNPREFNIEPNPAIALVMFELLEDALPPDASWISALGSIVDYCPEPAADLIARHREELKLLDELENTFLACQYLLPYTTMMAEFVSTIPSPEEFLERDPFRNRREKFTSLLSDGLESADVRSRIVVAETSPGEFRISSPLANRLQDRYTDLCVIVGEVGLDVVRFSVRYRDGKTHLGSLLETIAHRIGAGDGTGHERAASARIPISKKKEFITELEREIG